MRYDIVFPADLKIIACDALLLEPKRSSAERSPDQKILASYENGYRVGKFSGVVYTILCLMVLYAIFIGTNLFWPKIKILYKLFVPQ